MWHVLATYAEIEDYQGTFPTKEEAEERADDLVKLRGYDSARVEEGEDDQ